MCVSRLTKRLQVYKIRERMQIVTGRKAPAGKPHMRFGDEGILVEATPRSGFLLCKIKHGLLFVALGPPRVWTGRFIDEIMEIQ